MGKIGDDIGEILALRHEEESIPDFLLRVEAACEIIQEADAKKRKREAIEMHCNELQHLFDLNEHQIQYDTKADGRFVVNVKFF